MKHPIQTGTLLTLIIGGLLLLFFVMQKLAALLILILIAIVLTTSIDPLVERLQAIKFRRLRLSRGVATLLVVLFGLLALVGAFTFLVTTALEQATKITQEQLLYNPIQRWIDHLHSLKFYSNFIPNYSTMTDRLLAQSGEIGGYLWSTSVAIFGLLGGLASVFVVFILTFFFTTFKSGIVYNISLFIPPKYLPRARIVSHHAAMKMGGWLRGQLTLALIITLTVSLGMVLVGFPAYSMLVGIIGGMGELIPMVGPYLAFIPALCIVIFTHPHTTWQIVGIIIYFVALAEVEAYILAPMIMQKKVGLHPVTTILALFIGGSFLGVLGALLAIPLTAGARIILLEAIFPAIQKKTTEEIMNDRPAERRKRCLDMYKQRQLRVKHSLSPRILLETPAEAEMEKREDCL